jgi:hypothetical protein
MDEAMTAVTMLSRIVIVSSRLTSLGAGPAHGDEEEFP